MYIGTLCSQYHNKPELEWAISLKCMCPRKIILSHHMYMHTQMHTLMKTQSCQ